MRLSTSLLSAGHVEESPDDSRAGAHAERRAGKDGDYSDDRSLDPHDRWTMVNDASTYATGAGRASHVAQTQHHPTTPTTAAHYILSAPLALQKGGPYPTRFVVKSFG